MAPQYFSRQELYDLVWSGPMRSVAEKIGLSDVGLKKAVVKAGLPTPPQGYWNKLAAGKKVGARPEMPPRGFGTSKDIRIGQQDWRQGYRQLKLEDPVPQEPVFCESLDNVRGRATKLIGRLSVPRDLKVTHPALSRIIADEAARAEKVRTSRWPSSWDAPRFTSPLDQRRLRLLNAVCLGVAKAGLKASLWRKEDATFYLQSDEVSLPLIVRKLVRKGKGVEGDSRLSIVVGEIPGYGGEVVAQWDDTETQKLEATITEIVVDIAVLMEDRYRQQQIQYHQRMLKDRAENIEKMRLARIEAERLERERQEKLARERVESLLADADQLKRAIRLAGCTLPP